MCLTDGQSVWFVHFLIITIIKDINVMAWLSLLNVGHVIWVLNSRQEQILGIYF